MIVKIVKNVIYILSVLFFFGCATEFKRLSTSKDNGFYDFVELGHLYCVVIPKQKNRFNTPYCLTESEIKLITADNANFRNIEIRNIYLKNLDIKH